MGRKITHLAIQRAADSPPYPSRRPAYKVSRAPYIKPSAPIERPVRRSRTAIQTFSTQTCPLYVNIMDTSERSSHRKFIRQQIVRYLSVCRTSQTDRYTPRTNGPPHEPPNEPQTRTTSQPADHTGGPGGRIVKTDRGGEPCQRIDFERNCNEQNSGVDKNIMDKL